MVNDRELSFLLRSGSSVSLKEHSTDSPELLPSRSSQVLVNRGSLYPALPPDLSLVVTEETTQRRTLHKKLMDKSPGIFKRVITEDSPSYVRLQQYRMKDLMEGLHEDQKPSRSTLKESDLAEIKKIQSMRATPSLQSLGLTSSSLRRSLRDTNQFSKNSEDYENSQFQYNNTNQRPSTTSSSINYKTQSKVPFKITSIDDGIYPSNNSTPQNSPRGNSNNTSKDFPIPSESSSLSSSISQSINNSNNNKEFRNENSLATKKSLSSSIVSIEDYLKKISKNNFEEFCNETLNNNNNNKEFYSTNNSMKNTKNNTINKKNNTIEINKNILFNNNISLKLNYLANNNDEMKKNKQEYLENKKLDSFNKSKKWHNEYLERKNDFYETKMFSSQLCKYKESQDTLAQREREDIDKFEKSLKLMKYNVGTKGLME